MDSKEILQIPTLLEIVRNELVVDQLEADKDKSWVFCHLFVIQFLEKLQKRNIETLNGEVLLSFMEILFQIWKLDPNKLKPPSETGSEIGEEISSEKI